MTPKEANNRIQEMINDENIADDEVIRFVKGKGR